MNYFTKLKNLIFLDLKDWGILSAVIFGSFIIGEIATTLIMNLGNADTYFSLGSLLAIVVLCLSFLFIATTAFLLNFDYMIKMGKTRLSSFVLLASEYYLVSVFMMLLCKIFFYIDSFYRFVFYNSIPLENGFSFNIPWPAVFFAGFAIIPFIVLIALALQRFGKAFFWVLWAIWMFGCIGLPKLMYIKPSPDNSVLEKLMLNIQMFFANMPVSIGFIFIGLIFVICVVLNLLMVRRYSVKS